MSRVFLGVGHGGSDPGAVANGLRESDLNLQIALYCAEILESHGVTVGMSRKRDENDPLSEEIRECNAFRPDLAIDIHNNAGGGSGSEIFYTIHGGKGKTLATNIEKVYVADGRKSRGIKTKVNASGYDYFGFIRETSAPAIIVECAFVDSADYKVIDEAHEQKKFGEYIAKGVLATLGIPYKGNTTPNTSNSNTTNNSNNTSSSNVLYRVIAGSFKTMDNAKKSVESLKKIGYDAFILEYRS